MSHSARRFLPLRSLTVCLALVANLFAVGVPLLHSAAHALADHHAHEIAAAAEHEASHEHPSDDEHDEVHPSSLHDEGVLLRRIAPDVSVLPPATLAVIDAAAEHRAPASRPVASLRSRAPPPGDPARAPPPA